MSSAIRTAFRRWLGLATMTAALVPAVARAQPERAAPAPPEAAPEQVALSQAVERALARNPSITVASAEIARAEALVAAGQFP